MFKLKFEVLFELEMLNVIYPNGRFNTSPYKLVSDYTFIPDANTLQIHKKLQMELRSDINRLTLLCKVGNDGKTLLKPLDTNTKLVYFIKLDNLSAIDPKLLPKNDEKKVYYFSNLIAVPTPLAPSSKRYLHADNKINGNDLMAYSSSTYTFEYKGIVDAKDIKLKLTEEDREVPIMQTPEVIGSNTYLKYNLQGQDSGKYQVWKKGEKNPLVEFYYADILAQTPLFGVIELYFNDLVDKDYKLIKNGSTEKLKYHIQVG
ncbi:MAG: hypothetical protein NW226_18100 [Microscillaceae bacterium]|nr:hypothetical protein [Microscillaceae bacterium]